MSQALMSSTSLMQHIDQDAGPAIVVRPLSQVATQIGAML
jgi:hypothetical protein